MKSNNAITLIALVVTIIVLLILAGVSISMVSGDNGIAIKAKNAADQTKEKSIKEQIELAIMSSRVNDKNYLDIELLETELKRSLGNDIAIEKKEKIINYHGL